MSKHAPTIATLVLAALGSLPAPAQARVHSDGATLERYLASMSWPLRASTGRARRVSDAIKGAISPGDPPFFGMVAESCRKLRAVEDVGRSSGAGAILTAVPPAALETSHRTLARTYSNARRGCVRARLVALSARRAIGALGVSPTDEEISRAAGALLDELVRFDRTKLRPFRQAVQAWRNGSLALRRRGRLANARLDPDARLRPPVGRRTKVWPRPIPSVDVIRSPRQDKEVVAFVLDRVRDRQDGQAMVEYALILFMAALVVISILGAMGGTVSSMLSVVSSEFP